MDNLSSLAESLEVTSSTRAERHARKQRQNRAFMRTASYGPQYQFEDESDQEADYYADTEDNIDYSKHFTLPAYQHHIPDVLGYNSVVVEGGDVHISLSGREEDTVILSSVLLLASSPFWESKLRSDWSPDLLVNESYIKRYELEFSSPTESVLVSKTSITPRSIRDAQNEMIMQSDSFIKSTAPTFFPELSLQRANITFSEFREAIICAHKLGFALVCGHPLTAHATPELTEEPSSFTLVILGLLDWIQEYGDLEKMWKRVVWYILRGGEADGFRNDYSEAFPYTWLKIAFTLRSKEILEKFTPAAVAAYARSLRDANQSTSRHSALLKEVGDDARIAAYIVAEYCG